MTDLFEPTRRADCRPLLADPDDLTVVHSPVVDLAGGEVTGWSAAARFPGTAAPDVWFAAAHDAGLAGALDDCTDILESVGQHIVLYRMDGLMEGIARQMTVIVRMAELTADAMPRLASMKAMPDYWVEINRLENEGDQIYRALLGDIFDGRVSDPVELIKHKDVIERLEHAADAFEQVAHRVESIAIKES